MRYLGSIGYSVVLSGFYSTDCQIIPFEVRVNHFNSNRRCLAHLNRINFGGSATGGPLYSLKRSVPAISLYGNIFNRLLEDQINLPAKMHLDGKQGRFGRTTGSAGPTLPPLATVLLWYTAWWVLMSDGRCRARLVGLVWFVGLLCSCYAGHDHL